VQRAADLQPPGAGALRRRLNSNNKINKNLFHKFLFILFFFGTLAAWWPAMLYERQHHHQCPCCGYYTLAARGEYAICPVCFWEDDNAAEHYGQTAHERPRGPNGVHLWQARKNFLRFGASEEHFKEDVRPPYADEMPGISQG
jgi:hypothetical protein